jgi:hypothetical protein
MGTIQHHAIVVSGSNSLHAIAEKAREIGCVVLGPSEPQTNMYSTICVIPDGSKECWPESKDGDDRRAEFVRYLESPGVYADWVEVTFGEYAARVTNGSCLEDL